MTDRDEIERKLARVVGRGLNAELEKLLGHLGDPPRLENVPPEYWENGWRQLQREVEPILLDAFVSQATELMLNIGIGVDVDEVNRHASEWARAHTFDMMKQLWSARHQAATDLFNHYPGVGEIIAEGFEQALTIREIRDRLAMFYSPVRAEMIAVTETTRAVVEGERAYVDQLERETGQRMIPIWMTANDERVCPICAPRNEKPILNSSDFPPAHPRCRCGVGWEFPKAGE